MDTDTLARRAAEALDKAEKTGDLTDVINAHLELGIAEKKGVTAEEIAAHRVAA